MRSSRAVLIAALAASVLLAGCSGADDEETARPSEVATAATDAGTGPDPGTLLPDGGENAAPGGVPAAGDAATDPGAPSGGASAAPTAGGLVGGVKDKATTNVAPGKASAPAPGPAVLKLGGVFPLSGPLGSVGTAMMEAVQAVLTQANAAGGVNGSKLELVVADDQFDPVRGKALIQKLIEQDKVFAFAGIFSPFTTQAALPVIQAAGVPVFPSGSDDREFDEPLLFPVTNPCGRQMAGNVQHLIKEKKLTKLAVVYVNVEAVTNCTKQFSAVAESLGGEIVFSGPVAPGAPDCASRIVAARASGAQGLIVITENLGTVKCLQARQQQGWDVPVSISYNNTDDPVILRGLGAAAEGMLSSSPFAGAASPAFTKQCGAIKTYYPDSRVQFFSLVGCLGAKLLIKGLEIAGADRVALVKVLESGRKFAFGDLVPTLSYGPGRHLPYDLTASVEVRDGTWVRTGPLYTPAGAVSAPSTMVPLAERQAAPDRVPAALLRRAQAGVR